MDVLPPPVRVADVLPPALRPDEVDERPRSSPRVDDAAPRRPDAEEAEDEVRRSPASCLARPVGAPPRLVPPRLAPPGFAPVRVDEDVGRPGRPELPASVLLR